MSINFRIEALQLTEFQTLLSLSNDDLISHHAKWVNVSVEPGYPCRVSLVDARVGEQVLALSFTHHDVDSPYRASGPIFVRKNAETTTPEINEIPLMFRHRRLSVRAYSSDNFIVDVDVVQGEKLEQSIEKQFQNSVVDYLHIHNANPGCFNCAVYRA